MRCITRKFERALVRGAAVILVGGVAAGCSSDVSRFKASDFANGRSTNRAVAMAPASQPYPGDTGYQSGGLDTTYTGSVNRQAVRPGGLVGGVQPQPLPAPGTYGTQQPLASTPAASAAPIQRQPIAAPTSSAAAPAAVQRPPLDQSSTGSVAQQKQRGTVITVQEGETAYNLSRRFSVPVSAILSANGMSSAAELKAGQQIVIPTYVYSRPAPASSSGGQTQTAARETAPKAPAPQPQQQERLAVLPQTPKPRSRPAPAETNTAASNTNAGQVGAGGSYTVVSGDTLYGIARKTGVSAANIKAANSLGDGYLQVGQKLVIPAGQVSQPVQVAAAPKRVDTTTTSATTRAPEPAAATAQAPSSGGTQVAAVASDNSAVAPDSTGIGKLRWPVRGRIVSEFGSAAGSARNDGIDIAVPAGTPVKSAENGVVIYAGDGLKEFGNTVLVRHDDGMVTVYGHASALRVKRGDKVKRGQEIALSGMSGNADSPKLHFEVRKDATPVNPTGYLE
ncbi:peptidoglycan DD-metalloendopeptidase family protein [Nitratireductor sp. ZSWI3]|uniref:peptidoglycan DD-metalloendopeptidase family protein n=1 Tax=Nitratireductor sp. ZSWI3 TaxID=2966359 RepID=UPI00214FB87F|nr:peptidoglycan DD-metalloendopeptidase family protein [Nitratireductor sp. ZSWI3]MCR4267531.1 peptidoglycan DD-metalloendopeptidase family protein [Nitratireductor sp. ZSWI3]